MIMDWNTYFFNIINVVKEKSKDPNTHIGCVIVGPDNEIRSTGYNSFPRGINDNVPERKERPEKYFWMSHAEASAIANAAKTGISTDKCTLYVSVIPCADCARLIINCGVKHVIYMQSEQDKWSSGKYDKTNMERSLIMFNEAGITVTAI